MNCRAPEELSDAGMPCGQSPGGATAIQALKDKAPGARAWLHSVRLPASIVSPIKHVASKPPLDSS